MKNHVLRSAIAFWLILGTALTSVAADLKKIRFITDWYPQPEHGGFYYAKLKGYYQEAGLDVEILPGGPTSFAVPKVASGQVEFGMSATDDILLSRERGIPVVAVGATMQHDPQGVMVHEGSPIRKLEDLEGSTVAVGTGAAWFRYFIKRYNFKTIKERPLLFSVAPFLKDTNYISQCFVTSEPYFVRKAGVKARVLLLRDSGYDPYRVFFTSQKYMDENPAIVQAFVTASIRGWKDYMDDPEVVHAELQKRNRELDAEKMMFSWRALKEGQFVLGDTAKGDAVGQFVDARWLFQYQVLKDLKLIKSGFDCKVAFTTKFARATR